LDDVNYRVLVCGSRTFSDGVAISTVLDGISTLKGGRLTVIHGAAKGADQIAGMWADARGRTQTPFAADWVRYGKRAGYLRNQQMLDEGHPDVVWAFVDKPLESSKGTKMMVDIARTAGVQCYVVQVEPETYERKGT
jgi:hypothetical protein